MNKEGICLPVLLAHKWPIFRIFTVSSCTTLAAAVLQFWTKCAKCVLF